MLVAGKYKLIVWRWLLQAGLVAGGQPQFVAMTGGTGQQFMVGGRGGAFGGFVGSAQPPQYASQMGMPYRHAPPV